MAGSQNVVTFAVAFGLPKLKNAGPARSFRSGLVPPEPEERVMTEPKNLASSPHGLLVNNETGTAASAKISVPRFSPLTASTPAEPSESRAVIVVFTATAPTPAGSSFQYGAWK